MEDVLKIGCNNKSFESSQGFYKIEFVLTSSLSFSMMYLTVPGTSGTTYDHENFTITDICPEVFQYGQRHMQYSMEW